MTAILNSKKAIFIHIHKCAGTSIESALGNIMEWNDIILGSTSYGAKLQPIYREKFDLHKHSYASDVKRVIGEEKWQSYFNFSVVRHPLDRMVSLYEYLNHLNRINGNFFSKLKQKIKIFLWENRQHPFLSNARLIQYLREREIKPEQWPLLLAFLESENFSDFILAACNKDHPAKGAIPQVEYLLDEDKTNIAVNFVGKFENLEDDWDYITQKLGLVIPLPKVNTSIRKYRDWREYYTLNDLNFMLEKYKIDMEYFGYSV